MLRAKNLRLWSGMGIVAILLFLLGTSWPASAAIQAQFTPFPTPTPGPDGRIVYIVQANDSWWRIAAIHAIDLNDLLRLNDATSETVLLEGEEVLLGFGGPSEVTPTVGPRPTEGPSLPTPTAQPGSGTLCVILYNDINGDSIRQEEEPSIPDGAISVSDQSGEVSLTETTPSGMEPFCFEELMQGEYKISIAVPDGYNPTTVLNYTLMLDPGTETYLDFGAQVSSAAVVEPTSTGGNRTLLLGIAGGALLLGGIGLGIYAALMGRGRPKRLAE
ncbi:MAG: LysM peptidoglycan-binding domain-containing protein [Chloroflexota bacterium]|nr:MAG: LysM peptidoglycan-binding domain-containing protein [Chloroflexota bacterium]